MCSCNQTESFDIDGRAPFDPQERPEVGWRVVTPRYFAALEIPLRAGRVLTGQDGPAAPLVVVVNEALAGRFFPAGDAIGARIRFAPDGDPVEIVGVVGDVRHHGPARPAEPELYVAAAQFPAREMTLLVRAAGDPALLLPAIRGQVQALDPDQPVFGEGSMNAVVRLMIQPVRFSLRLLGAMALLALSLAGVGIYGVMAQLMAERTREIGLRVALGGSRGEVTGLVLRQGMRPAVIGLAAGLGGAVLLTQGMRRLLVGVNPTDPGTLGLVSALMLGVALLACWVPARRAAGMDPMVALRSE
jgi:predicted permease